MRATMKMGLTRAAKIFNLGVSAHAVSTFRTVHQIHITCKWAVQSAVVVLSNAQPFSGTVCFTSTVSHHLMRS